jgi:hypothetical protein
LHPAAPRPKIAERFLPARHKSQCAVQFWEACNRNDVQTVEATRWTAWATMTTTTDDDDDDDADGDDDDQGLIQSDPDLVSPRPLLNPPNLDMLMTTMPMLLMMIAPMDR